MKNNNEGKVYDVRVIPFVKYVKKIVDGKPVEDVVDVLTLEERANLSIKLPSILRMNNGIFYLAEAPLVFKGGTGVRGTLFYMFDKLTKEEQEKYFDRSIIIKMNKPEEVIIYGEESKRFFGKRKTKKRK